MADVRRGSTVGGGEQMEGADFNFRYNLGKREPTALERVVGYVSPFVNLFTSSSSSHPFAL